VRELLAERLDRLSPEGRQGVRRVLAAVEAAERPPAQAPERAWGTWLQQTWIALGGEACSTPHEQRNLDVLWPLFDALAAASGMFFPACSTRRWPS